jgi:hypothetical protein
MKPPEVPKRFENFREAVRRGDTSGAGDGQQLFGYTKVSLSQRFSGMLSAFENSLLLISGSKVRVLVRPPTNLLEILDFLSRLVADLI